MPGELSGRAVAGWLEEAAALQQLGRLDEALDLYRKVLDAWGEGDELVQPVLTRVRDAMASIRGEVRELERR